MTGVPGLQQQAESSTVSPVISLHQVRFKHSQPCHLATSSAIQSTVSPVISLHQVRSLCHTTFHHSVT
eukprot:1156440-Pelagomonas_calceolata.AAC.9